MHRLPVSLQVLLNQVTVGFRSLRNSPGELWKAYALKFLDSYSYFSLSIVFTLFLSNDFGYSDIEAGTIYGLWGALITVYGLVAGCIVDNLGVARSLQLGFALSCLSRTWILFARTRTALLLNVCLLLPMGNCLGIPVLTTGIRRYTTDGNRGFAFGLFYVVMNVAALLSGPLVDICTIAYNKDQRTDSTRDFVYNPNEEWKLTGYRMVVLTGVVANVVAVLIAFTVREIKLEPASETPANEMTAVSTTCTAGNDGVIRDAVHSQQLPQERDVLDRTPMMDYSTRSTAVNSPLGQNQDHGRVAKFVPIQGSAWTILNETVRTKRFWRFLIVCLITLNVRMIFRHLDATLPKYMVREFGENVPKGTIYSINPAIIIGLVPLVTAATSKVDPLLMIHNGSYVSAASVFVLALSTSIWSSVVFVVLLSIGEAVWSPRLYDYTMDVSPEGREGTYMALSSAPLFLAKLPVGFLSGYLLEKYCPKEGARESKKMWLIIGMLTAVSPVAMTAFWKYISHRDSDSETSDNDREMHARLAQSDGSGIDGGESGHLQPQQRRSNSTVL